MVRLKEMNNSLFLFDEATELFHFIDYDIHTNWFDLLRRMGYTSARFDMI